MHKFTFSSILCLIVVMLSSCTKESDLKTEIPYNNDPSYTVDNQSFVVSYEDALSTLQNILGQIDETETRSGNNRVIANYHTVGSPIGENLTRSANGEYPDPYIHIFNFEDEEGYALISGDTRTPAVLAITDKGAINEDTEIDNPGLITVLANMEYVYYKSIEDYEIIREPTAPTTTWVEYSDWYTSLYGTNGLSFNDWNQWDPYNSLLNRIDGSLPPAGCTATATAIMMAFHKHPAYYNGYTYNWNEMVKHRPMGVHTYYSPAYAQIGRLFQQLGLANNLNMSYSLTGSGADFANIPRTLRNFGYSNGGKLADYNQTTVFDELKSGYAVLVSGCAFQTITKKKVLGITIKTTTTYSEGHSWVLDRIMIRFRYKNTYNNGIMTGRTSETHELVRCNFGWGGTDNGYYYSRSFDTNAGPVTRSGTSGNYQYQQRMITNIRK